jgi:hypothetical protein
MTNFHPNPASVLATLIHNGLATEPPDALPPEWRAGYQAALACSERSGMFERRLAFRQAIADDPAGLTMEAAVKKASKDLPLPGQARLFTAWETQYSPPPVSETVVEGIFERSSLNLIVGAPGSKKTWAAIDLAVSVASGQPWLGHSTSRSLGMPDHADEAFTDSSPLSRGGVGGGVGKGSPVLFIDAEGTVKRMWDRLGATMRGHVVDPRIPLHFYPPAFMNFTRESDAEYITKVAIALDVKLIIIDALVNVMGGADENNVLSVQPIFDSLRNIATNTGAAVVVIHHTNKEGVFRGSSFLSSTVDHMLLVESQPDDPLIRLQTYKARDLAPVLLTARAVFTAAPIVEAHGHAPSPGEARRQAGGEAALSTFNLQLVDNKLQSKLNRTSAAIVDHLSKQKIASPAQLIESVPYLRPSSFRSVIADLITLGLVFRADGGGRGSSARYSLTSDGQIYVSN